MLRKPLILARFKSTLYNFAKTITLMGVSRSSDVARPV